jgi:hypothetical protein
MTASTVACANLNALQMAFVRTLSQIWKNGSSLTASILNFGRLSSPKKISYLMQKNVTVKKVSLKSTFLKHQVKVDN